jgi:hypothetical protein
MKSKLEIYALAVCFAAIVCLVISIGIAGYSIVEITNPYITIRAYDYDKYQSNDSYWDSKIYDQDQKTVQQRPSEEELTKKRQEAMVIALKGERREGIQSLIQSLMFILAGGVTLLVHWQIAKRARTEKA